MVQAKIQKQAKDETGKNYVIHKRKTHSNAADIDSGDLRKADKKAFSAI